MYLVKFGIFWLPSLKLYIFISTEKSSALKHRSSLQMGIRFLGWGYNAYLPLSLPWKYSDVILFSFRDFDPPSLRL